MHHHLGHHHLGHQHCWSPRPRCGTPRASPQPLAAPGGDIRVMPEVFLTPSRARATVYITWPGQVGRTSASMVLVSGSPVPSSEAALRALQVL